MRARDGWVQISTSAAAQLGGGHNVFIDLGSRKPILESSSRSRPSTDKDDIH